MSRDWPRVDLLTHRAQNSLDRPALLDVHHGSHRTAGELHERASGLAGALKPTVEPGDRVALLLGTSPRFVELYWAIRRLGGTVVPLNVQRASSQLQTQLQASEASLLICEEDSEATAVGLSEECVLSIDEPHHDDVDILSRTQAEPASAASGQDSIAVVLFTSGTTGNPKGVPLTVGNIVWSAIGSALRLGVSASDRWLCCIPMYHTGGLAPIVRTVVYGSTLAVQRTFDATATARYIESHGITGVSLIPTMLHRLLSAGWDPPDHLETVLLGGAPAGAELLEDALATGVPVAPTYGLTEAASQVATARPATVREHPESVGPPLLTTDVTIVDDEGNPVRDGELGELVVSGPTVTSGYLDQARNASAFGQHGLHTGDLGKRDETGRLWIRGRLDDRINTGGEIVQPNIVIEVLERHPAVERATVVGIPDPEWGERVAALVTLIEEATVTEAELVEHCRASLADFEVPRTLRIVERLPRTPSGTVDREAVTNVLSDEGQV